MTALGSPGHRRIPDRRLCEGAGQAAKQDGSQDCYQALILRVLTAPTRHLDIQSLYGSDGVG